MSDLAFIIGSDHNLMAISLTVVVDEIARDRELLPENTCVIHVQDRVCGRSLLINCGGSPSALLNNCEKLNIDIYDVDVVVLTSVSVRYWSSLKFLLERTRRNMTVVYPYCNNFQMYNIESLCRRLKIRNVALAQSIDLCSHVKLLLVNVTSTYAEIQVELRGEDKSLVVSIPNLGAAADPDRLLMIKTNLQLCSIPLSPLMLDYTTIVRRLCTRARSYTTVYMCNPTPLEVRKELRDRCSAFRDSYVGLRLSL